MARRKILYNVCLSLLLPTVHAQGEIEFLYNTQVDTCIYEGITGGQGNLTANGGLCAYDPSVKRLYSCWIGVQCWQLDQTCEKGAEAGDDQILCNGSGATWCCTNTEECTTAPGQINVCNGVFANPNGGNTSVEEAVSKEYKALGVTTIPSTLSAGEAIISASATPFTTSSFTTGTASTTSTSGTSSSTASSRSTSTHASAASAPSATAVPTAPPAKNGPAVSSGAIAGIVVGVLAAVALAAIVWLLLRKRKRRSSLQWPHRDVSNMLEAPIQRGTKCQLIQSQPNSEILACESRWLEEG